MQTHDSYAQDYSGWSTFLSGACIGAGIALLLAPQTGAELRATLRSYASTAKDEFDEVAERGRAAWDKTVEEGERYVETGKEALREAGRATRQYAEAGARAVDATEEEAARHRS